MISEIKDLRVENNNLIIECNDKSKVKGAMILIGSLRDSKICFRSIN